MCTALQKDENPWGNFLQHCTERENHGVYKIYAPGE